MANNLIKYSLVDAFTESAFKGNPAAVCFLEEEREELWLQSIAAEFNIAATCFVTRLTESEPRHSLTRSPTPRFRLRWFTPVAELGLCGHGTLASAHALFTSGKIDSDIIEFVTLSGTLTAKKVADSKPSNGCNTQANGEAQKSFFIELDFPSDPSTEFVSAESDSSLISKALGEKTSIVAIRRTNMDKLIVVLPSAKCVADVEPDFGAIEKCPGVGIVVTGIAPPESGFDFHSRFFCPKFKINEDPVCGSAHCALAVYWSKQLGKSDFVAYQASPRGGTLNLHLDEQRQRVTLQGKACTVMVGTILV